MKQPEDNVQIHINQNPSEISPLMFKQKKLIEAYPAAWKAIIFYGKSKDEIITALSKKYRINKSALEKDLNEQLELTLQYSPSAFKTGCVPYLGRIANALLLAAFGGYSGVYATDLPYSMITRSSLNNLSAPFWILAIGGGLGFLVCAFGGYKMARFIERKFVIEPRSKKIEKKFSEVIKNATPIEKLAVKHQKLTEKNKILKKKEEELTKISENITDSRNKLHITNNTLVESIKKILSCQYRTMFGNPTLLQLEKVKTGREIIITKKKDGYHIYYKDDTDIQSYTNKKIKDVNSLPQLESRYFENNEGIILHNNDELNVVKTIIQQSQITVKSEIEIQSYNNDQQEKEISVAIQNITQKKEKKLSHQPEKEKKNTQTPKNKNGNLSVSNVSLVNVSSINSKQFSPEERAKFAEMLIKGCDPEDIEHNAGPTKNQVIRDANKLLELIPKTAQLGSFRYLLLFIITTLLTSIDTGLGLGPKGAAFLYDKLVSHKKTYNIDDTPWSWILAGILILGCISVMAEFFFAADPPIRNRMRNCAQNFFCYKEQSVEKNQTYQEQTQNIQAAENVDTPDPNIENTGETIQEKIVMLKNTNRQLEEKNDQLIRQSNEKSQLLSTEAQASQEGLIFGIDTLQRDIVTQQVSKRTSQQMDSKNHMVIFPISTTRKRSASKEKDEKHPNPKPKHKQ